MKYDLILKGGRAVDAAVNLDRSMDIGIAGEIISDVASDLNPAEAEKVMDVSGFIVSPGLIDFHAHAAFLNDLGLGKDTDSTCFSSGVTTLVDAGSSGAATFPAFKEFLMGHAQTRLRVFLHISSIGLADLKVGESTYLNLHDCDRAAEIALENAGIIIGIKVRQQREAVGDNGLKPLLLAKQAASLAGGLPIMVHVTNPPVPLKQILEHLEGGDIVTHFLNGSEMGILDDTKRIRESVMEARRRGVIFDVGHGRKHVNFDVSRIAIAEGFFPDTVSSDLHRAGKVGTAKNLPNVLSKFLNLGMDLPSVLTCATTNPARLLNMERSIGTLKKGAVADIAVFKQENGDFPFEDTDGNTLTGQTRLVPKHTICRGMVVWPGS